jgi:hypothetical protein
MTRGCYTISSPTERDRFPTTRSVGDAIERHLATVALCSNRLVAAVVSLVMTLSARLPRIVRAAVALSIVVVGATACQPPQPGWKDIPPAPNGAAYEGSAETVLDQRLASRVEERNQKVLDSRLEQLPLDVTFEQHVAWRAMNSDDMTQLIDRIPEPDAPVMMAEFVRAGRTLYLIGTVAAGRTVVLTALTSVR